MRNFVALSFLIAFGLVPMASAQKFSGALELMDTESIKMTFHSHALQKVSFKGNLHLMTSNWHELMIRLYPLSDNGSIDEDNMVFLPLKE